MRPALFEYSRPTTLAAALSCLATGATPLAGGQSLVQAMRLREAEPAAVFELAGIAELDSDIRFESAHVHIGALVTHRQLAEHAEIAHELPWLTQAARALGDVQVRNLGTVLGNVCWADPRANMVVALLASDALIVTAQSAGATERIACTKFFTGFRKNALGGRLATAIEIPRRAQARGSYIEFSRQPQDLALVNVAVVVHDDTLRIAVGGIDPTAVRLASVEAAHSDRAAISRALTAELILARHAPIVDHYGSSEYKLRLCATLIRRALAATLGRDEHG